MAIELVFLNDFRENHDTSGTVETFKITSGQSGVPGFISSGTGLFRTEEVDPQKNETQYVRFFFGTTSRPLFSGTLQICREGAVAVPAVTDGQWQEYILDMASNPLWQGMINELWFDPPQKHSTYIDIRRMEFLP